MRLSPILFVLLVVGLTNRLEILAEESTPPEIATWESLQTEIIKIADVKDGTIKLADLKKIPGLENITSDKRYAALWWEMVSQPKYPFVVAAGFECINTASADDGFAAALRIISSQPKDFGLCPFVHVELALQNADVSEANIRAITKFAHQSALMSQSSALLGLAFLPPKLLAAWWDEVKPASVPSDFEAMVLGELLPRKPDQSKATEYLDRLRFLSICPGVARAVYIGNAPETDPGFMDKLQRVLEDDSLDSVIVVPNVYPHRAA